MLRCRGAWRVERGSAGMHGCRRPAVGPYAPPHPDSALRHVTRFSTSAPSGGSFNDNGLREAVRGDRLALDAAAQGHARAAVLRQVGVDDLAPVARVRHADAVALADARRPVDDRDDRLVGVGAGALEGDDAVFVVAAVDPLEAGGS